MISGGGDDSIDSRIGNDTFVFSSGFGNIFLNEENSSTGFVDSVVFTDLASSEVELSRIGNDAFLTELATGMQIELDEQFYSSDYWGVEQIVFSDGVLLDRDAIQALSFYRGTSGIDSISTSSLDDVVISGGGDDSIDSGVGNDTFVFSSGFGNVFLNEENSSTGFVDRIVFTDLSSSEVQLSRSGNDAFLTELATGMRIELDEQFYSSDYWGVEEIVFSDGVVLDRDAIQALAEGSGIYSGEIPGH